MNSSKVKVSRAEKPQTSTILTTRLFEVHVKHLSTLSPLRIYDLDSSLLSGTVSLPFCVFRANVTADSV